MESKTVGEYVDSTDFRTHYSITLPLQLSEVIQQHKMYFTEPYSQFPGNDSRCCKVVLSLR